MLRDDFGGFAPSPAASDVLLHPRQFLPEFATALQDELIFFTKDLRGVIQYASDSVQKHLSFAPTDLVGHACSEFLTDAASNEKFKAEDFVAETDTPISEFHVEVLDGQQNARRLRLWSMVLKQSNAPVGYVVMAMVNPHATLAAAELQSADVDRLLKLASELTLAERAVVELVVDGNMNKAMARILGVAVRTIEARRARAMSKLQVRSLPELVKAWMAIKAAGK